MSAPLPASPLAPSGFPELPEIAGVRFATTAAGIKYSDRPDVMLAVLDPGTTVVGVFTRSSTRSAAVLDCEDKIRKNNSGGAAILVNSGNANAFTGKAGFEAVKKVTHAAADLLGLEENRIFTSSTGVIGEVLPAEKVTGKLEDLSNSLGQNSLHDAARAIMTTDTFAKGASREILINGKAVKIAGIAKGSGMIAPDMATMLVYIFTDAACDRSVLQALVGRQNGDSFNCITVDGDTSTSDTLLVAATGASGVDVTGHAAFEKALSEVMMDLAHQVVRDGEGATKFVQINVTGAASNSDARSHAMSIANSPLVKTAIAGEDPNWGRIVMAVGKSGAAADRDLLSIRFGDILVAENGWVAEGYREEDGAGYMKQQELVINVDIGLDVGFATVWTCDLTHQYISINADYRS